MNKKILIGLLSILIIVPLASALSIGITDDGELVFIVWPTGSQASYINSYWAEENGILDNAQYEYSFGNGAVNLGLIMRQNGTLKGIAMYCGTSTGTAVVEIRSGATGTTSTGCNLTSTTTRSGNYNCNYPVYVDDVVRPYTITDTGHGYCVVTWWIEYNTTVDNLISTTPGGGSDVDKDCFGDDCELAKDMVNYPDLGSCYLGPDYIAWSIQMKDFGGVNLEEYAKMECWISDTKWDKACPNCVSLGDGGDGKLLYNTVGSGSRYYAHLISASDGALDAGFLGFEGGGPKSCWLMCTYDGIVYASEECENCPDGVIM